MLAPRSRVLRDDSSLLVRLESADSTRVCFCDSSLCVTRVIIGSSQSQVKSFLVVTRVKSSHFGSVTRVKSSHFGLPTRVKSSHHKMRLESTRVRVSDLTCYNTVKFFPISNRKQILWKGWGNFVLLLSCSIYTTASSDLIWKFTIFHD